MRGCSTVTNKTAKKQQHVLNLPRGFPPSWRVRISSKVLSIAKPNYYPRLAIDSNILNKNSDMLVSDLNR